MALALGATGAEAATLAGPRLAIQRFDFASIFFELFSIDPSGAQRQRIVGGSTRKRPLPYPTSAPSWSPDGGQIAFTGLSGSLHSTNESKAPVRIFVASPDGSGLRAVADTDGGLVPVFAPDGRTIAFARERERRVPNDRGGERTAYKSTSIWLTSLDGGPSRQLTPWRNRLENAPASFSPDGSVLAITRALKGSDPEAVALRLDGSGAQVLARHALQPMFSPDGSRIALLRSRERVYRNQTRHGSSVRVATVTDLFVVNADGSQLQRLTRTPRKLELWPSWDPSGSRIAFGELNIGDEADFFGLGNSVMEVNADGSCLTTVIEASRASAFYAPVWQPGPGREAGPIPC